MKKLLFLLLPFAMQAQDSYYSSRENTSAGSSYIGVTSSGISVKSTEAKTSINLGALYGHFILDKLALQVGADADILLQKHRGTEAVVNYQAGAKYYALPFVFVYSGFYGANAYDLNKMKGYADLRVGYAYFIKSLSIEPTVGYLVGDNLNFNISLNFYF